MSRKVQKTLTFPLAGVVRRGSYRNQAHPYSAPWAINVRGVESIEGRERGGSRPGLSKLSSTALQGGIKAMVPLVSVDSVTGTRKYAIVVIAGESIYLYRGRTTGFASIIPELTINGNVITIGGEPVAFQSTAESGGATLAKSAVARAGKLLLADNILREYDPQTGALVALTASEGVIPSEQPVICLYRDRVILTGKDHMWYASRMGEPSDWGFGADMNDNGRAVAGQIAIAGQIGSAPKAVIPVEDKALVFACENSLWIIQGDPATGRLECVSGEVGMIAPNAWAKSENNLMAFLSNDGVYLWQAGSKAAPVRFSEGRVPGQLRNVDPDSNTITMSYDPDGRGFYLFITPHTGRGLHWWLDIENKALWPIVFHDEHEPVAIARIDEGGMAEVIMGCRDGYIRQFGNSIDDDGNPLESHVLIGPVKIAADDVRDAMLTEIHGVMADMSGDVEWRVVMGSSAEDVADMAVQGIGAYVNGDTPCGVAVTGSWAKRRNAVVRPRTRGSWMVIWISAKKTWAFEAIAIVARQLGRLRI